MRPVLLHSPLVSSGTWRLLAPLLRAQGHDVVVPDYAHTMHGDGPYYPIIANVIDQAVPPSSEPTLFVAHSGAGSLVPMAAAPHDDAYAIFMDALLPHPGKSWLATAPESLNARLLSLARDGRVPPWHQWWPKGAIEKLLGDDLFVDFARELNDLTLAYFEETAPVVPELPATRCAYLQLSPAYSEIEVAEKSGWQTRRLDVNHLAMLTHPEAVASALTDLASVLVRH